MAKIKKESTLYFRKIFTRKSDLNKISQSVTQSEFSKRCEEENCKERILSYMV